MGHGVFITPSRLAFSHFFMPPPTASPRLCIRIHVALWPHTIDPCFLIAPPGGKQYPSAVWLPPIKKWSKCVLSRKTGFYGYLFVCLFVLQGFVYYLVLFFSFFLEDTVLPPYTTSVLIHLWPVQHSLFMCFYRNAGIYLVFSLDLATHMLMLIFALSSLTPSPDFPFWSPQQTYLHV